MNPETYRFHVEGMHCKACTVLIERELKEVPGVTRIAAHLGKYSAEVTGDFGDRSPEAIAALLTEKIRPHGYALRTEKTTHAVRWSDFSVALPLAAVFAFLFFLLQRSGLVQFSGTGDISYGTVFLIGIIASLSSCMAVVGGLLLSMSATFIRRGERIRPQLMFHASRLVSFFVLGGAIGAASTVFSLNGFWMSALNIVIGIVMLILGVNLLDVFPWAKRLQLSLPKVFSSGIFSSSKFGHSFAPLFAGFATFFLPCGFTQSMQLYTLSSGGFVEGGLTMLIFALGTLPVLALVSFGSLGIKNKEVLGIFFKTAGLIVILFALMNIVNGLVVAGLVPPLFSY